MQESPYQSQTPLSLHPLAHSLLISSRNSHPFFPPLLSKQLSQLTGLECNQSTFFTLMSNIVDWKLEQVIKDVKESGGGKKGGKDGIRTVDLEKIGIGRDGSGGLGGGQGLGQTLGMGVGLVGRPRVYPQMGVGGNWDDQIMPKMEEEK